MLEAHAAHPRRRRPSSGDDMNKLKELLARLRSLAGMKRNPGRNPAGSAR
jgi:hypothetical protein